MSKTSRASPTMVANGAKHSVKMFISYSHQDHVWMKRLAVFLNGLKYDDRLSNGAGLQFVNIWHDKELTVGNPWDSEIKQELEEMDIFVPLVSAPFFASWYIQEVELERAKARHGLDEILVVPILLDEVNLQRKSPFLHGFSSLPNTSRCWSKFRRVNDAYMLIDDGLWAAIDETLKRKRRAIRS